MLRKTAILVACFTPTLLIAGNPPSRSASTTTTKVAASKAVGSVETLSGKIIQFVYVGNLPGQELENTYCPACGALLIRRTGFAVLENRLHGPETRGAIITSTLSGKAA